MLCQKWIVAPRRALYISDGSEKVWNKRKRTSPGANRAIMVKYLVETDRTKGLRVKRHSLACLIVALKTGAQ